MLTFIIGSFFEEASCTLSNGKLLPINQNELYCPDVKVHDKLYIESKSIGRSAKAIIYENKISRQTIWALNKNADVYFYFWRHKLHFKKLKSKRKIRLELSKNCNELLIIPQVNVFSLISTPASIINNGNETKWKKGWFIKFSLLKSLCNRTYQKTIQFKNYTMNLTIYENSIN